MELSQQATVAQMMGEYAVGEGRKEAASGSSRPARPSPASRRPSTPGVARPLPGHRRPPPPPHRHPRPHRRPPRRPSGTGCGRSLRLRLTVGDGGTPAPSDDGLAIPGYDALSASQVVQRLAGLSDDELEAVRSYESTTRGRKTILNRVEQLRTGAPS